MVSALIKVGSLAVNSVISVAKSVLTASNIAEIATAGLADPVAGLIAFGTKLLGALPNLISPSTGIRLVQQVFTAVTDNIKDNSDLLLLSTWTKYGDIMQRHGSYQHDAVTGDGKPATAYVADWFVAAAQDVAAAMPKPSATATAKPSGASATPSPSATKTTPAPSSTTTSAPTTTTVPAPTPSAQ